MATKRKVKPIPEGNHALTAFICLSDAKAAIAFYKKAFGAKDVGKPLMMPDGKVAHHQLQIGDSRLMLSDESDQSPTRSPKSLKGTSAGLNLYLPDVDKVFARAVKLGATEVFPLADQFYGDRSGRIADPFGHHWILSTHIEDVSDAEMKKRMAQMAS